MNPLKTFRTLFLPLKFLVVLSFLLTQPAIDSSYLLEKHSEIQTDLGSFDWFKLPAKEKDPRTKKKISSSDFHPAGARDLYLQRQGQSLSRYSYISCNQSHLVNQDKARGPPL